ncbi:toll-like receptor 9 [Limanda limanda]|uniref:toll-like receptor 9 n=1 Tax=Limanda limanda TaxID=27771 RepID=UPI0029C6E948|nr:toll-like receptor 9 [Limanda limanda]
MLLAMALLRSILIIGQLLPLVRTQNVKFFPCDSDENATMVDCSDRSLKDVPSFTSNTVLSLNLSWTRINHVGRDAFVGVRNLQTLKIMWNCQPGRLRTLNDETCDMKIHPKAFESLHNLTSLYLSGNSLTSIPWLPETLKVLDLQNNCIFQITKPLKTPHLEELLLSRNCYYANPCRQSFYISETVFIELHKLQTLTLGYNNLTSIPEGLPPSLKNLDLKENTIPEVLDGAFANLTKLKSLDLAWNCQRCDHSARPCFPCLDDHPLHLYSNSFNASSSSMTYLSLRGNSLKTFPEGIFRPLKNLKSLDLSDNLLAYAMQNGTFFADLKGLTSINLLYNYEPLRTLDRLTLSPHIGNISGLTHLLLSGNFFHELSLSSLDVLSELKNLTSLELRMNFITNCNLTALTQLPSLIDIDISQNMLSFLPCNSSPLSETVAQKSCQNQNLCPHNFHEQPIIVRNREVPSGNEIWEPNQSKGELKSTLKVLDVSNNDFYFRMSGMGQSFEFLSKLTNLEVLSFANNAIGMRISQGLISSSVKYLYFSGNHLNVMWKSEDNRYTHFFQNLTSLIYLDISNNNLTSTPKDILCYLPGSLEALIISKNQLDYFPWHNLTALGNLCHLDLSENNLFQWPHKDIEFGANFSLLDLSHNHFSYIHQSLFKESKSLQYLYLSHNQIKELDHRYLPTPFTNGSGLRQLSLHHNPFKCDCDTSWFVDFLRTTTVQIPHVTKIHCGFPESKQGQSILSMDQHSCQDIYGSLAFLICSLLAVTFTVLPLLKHLYGWDMWYCLQVLWAGHKGYTQLAGTDSENRYDAFVVFDTNNQAMRDWVYNELTVHLENFGHRRFSLCLEERDWIPGLSCIENLHSAVHNSVKTVFVLSSGSDGGDTVNGVIRQAFYMVQQRLLDEKVDAAVLVLLDEMFPKLKYLELRKRLCRKSVLTWPKNPKAQPLFWNEMRMALSSDNLKLYDNNMSESFI